MVLDVTQLVQKAGAWLGITADQGAPAKQLNTATVKISAQAMAVANQKLLALAETATQFQEKKGKDNDNEEDSKPNAEDLKAYVNSLKPQQAFPPFKLPRQNPVAMVWIVKLKRPKQILIGK